ncbi:FAD-dependent monooxygenase [Actinomadura sp. BRA 177]|uniref:FAD-dependent monooxygenase n=1 Tax=Actinomadura sp. BRA 177 TaxID=2745202 RepID=UPI0028157A12|nr:FAD-dependent monooxygenase [Actinomadura sp. BRA 177]
MTSVIVVGGGPVGLMLALFLDYYDVPCTVLDAEPSTSDMPRGNTHNARTMEHYRRLGVADEIRALGLPADHPTDVAYFTRYGGAELARLRMSSANGVRRAVREAPDDHQTPEPLHRANQMYVERLLLARARTRSNITLRYGTRVSGIWQDGSGVSVHADRGTGRARYVVGCDGGQSVVRAGIGARYVGSGALDQEVLGRQATATHLRIPALYPDFLGSRRAWSYWALGGWADDQPDHA